jgi:hypothetical protein
MTRYVLANPAEEYLIAHAKRHLYRGSISTVRRFTLILEENPGRLEMISAAIHDTLGLCSVSNLFLIDIPGNTSLGSPPSTKPSIKHTWIRQA